MCPVEVMKRLVETKYQQSHNAYRKIKVKLTFNHEIRLVVIKPGKNQEAIASYTSKTNQPELIKKPVHQAYG
jgi:hypothetical protein